MKCQGVARWAEHRGDPFADGYPRPEPGGQICKQVTGSVNSHVIAGNETGPGASQEK